MWIRKDTTRHFWFFLNFKHKDFILHKIEHTHIVILNPTWIIKTQQMTLFLTIKCSILQRLVILWMLNISPLFTSKVLKSSKKLKTQERKLQFVKKISYLRRCQLQVLQAFDNGWASLNAFSTFAAKAAAASGVSPAIVRLPATDRPRPTPFRRSPWPARSATLNCQYKFPETMLTSWQVTTSQPFYHYDYTITIITFYHYSPGKGRQKKVIRTSGKII